MIRFVAMEILVAVALLFIWYAVVKYTRKPMKKIIEDVKEEYNKPDEETTEESPIKKEESK